MAAISTGRRIQSGQPALNTPDPSYHGAVWTEAVKPLGPIAYTIKARVTLLRDLGAALSPFNAFLTIQGIGDACRCAWQRHCENAQAVADFLRKRREVTRVIHPSHAEGRATRARANAISRAASAVWSASSSPAARKPDASSSTR